MGPRWLSTAAAALVSAGLAAIGPAATAATAAPATAHACTTPAAGQASCGAIQLLYPAKSWHPGPSAHASPGANHGGSTSVAPPTSGYFPGDLQSAYSLAAAAAAFGPGPAAPTVAIVDAYDDPYVASDLAAYRSAMSGATDPNTGIAGAVIPPLCSATVTSNCVTFKKVNQSGGTSYPRGNTGWAEEISLDVDMISAICPSCNITLVEASSASFSNLETAVGYAETLHPAAVTNSYGGNEFSSETSYNGTYSATSATAVTAATGDSGYGVEFPAASPGLTAVGGTSLTHSGSGASTVWSQTAWSGAGSGCSADEAMPAWQADQGVYSLSADCAGRQVADVSAVADPNTGVAVYDTYGEPGWMVFGGTSASTQIIGAVYALAAGNGGIAPAPSALYTDAGTTSTGATPGLTPVTSGTNTTNCSDYLCDAGSSLSSGYNGPTGLGTPDGITAFGTSTAPAPSYTLGFSPTSLTIASGATGSFQVTLGSPAPGGGLTVDLSTTSSTGSFSSSGASGNTLAVTVAGGGTASAPVYYTDTDTSGSPATSTITASASGWSTATMGVTVDPATTQPAIGVAVTAGSPVAKHRNYQVPLTVTATSGGSPLGGASVSLEVYKGGCPASGGAVASGTATTASSGTAGFTFTTKQVTTYCAVATVSESGYTTGTGSTTFSS